MLAISISFPQLHAGNSVQPGTNKRSNPDIRSQPHDANSLSGIVAMHKLKVALQH